MQKSRLVKSAALLAFIFSLPMHAQRAANTVLALNVGSQCGVSVLSSNQSAVSSGSSSEYTGTITFVYYLRTSAGAGSGNIELELVDGSGRAVNSSAAISYMTDLSGAGTANSGRQTVSSSSASFTVASFGADQHSPRQGSAGTINWTFNRDAMSSSNSSLPPTVHLNMACR
jgi:hypothetical protein